MERLYYIYLILKENNDYLPAKDIKNILADKYHISIDIKTIYQVIRNINELSYLIFEKEIIKTKHRKGYCIEEEFFEDGQLQYLLDSVIFNDKLNRDEVDNLVNKIKKISTKKQLDRIQIESVKQKNRDYNLLLNMTTVIKAIHNQQNIYFKYVSYEMEGDRLKEVYHTNGNHQDNKEFYIISPYKIIQKDSKYYVLGYFKERPDKLSNYRLDRMRLVRNHKSPYQPGEQFDLEQETKNININMYVSEKKSKLEILVDDTVIREVQDKFGQIAKVTKEYDNRYLLTAEDVPISEGLIGWLMMLQDHVCVVSPYDLKEDMKKRIEKMYQQYK